MKVSRPLHPDFKLLLEQKDKGLIELFKELRNLVLEIYPDSNELLYHTHALTAVFSVSEKLGDAFCMIPVYTNHLNLGFNKGSLLYDPHELLTGTGNLIRHVPVKSKTDTGNKALKDLVQWAADLALEELAGGVKSRGKTISKIKTGK